MIINTVSHNFRAAGATLLLIFGVHFQRFPVIVFPFLYLRVARDFSALRASTISLLVLEGRSRFGMLGGGYVR